MTLAPIPPRDAAELALGILHYCTDSSRHETHRLHLAADYLRDAGLFYMADTIAEAAGRACGSDDAIQQIYNRLWIILDARRHQERFEKHFVPEPNSGCWIWLSSVTNDGYGRFRLNGSRGAHRCAWLIYRGEIPIGLSVLHRCDNRQCVNPDHLFVGTVQDNSDDMVAKGRSCFGTRQHKAKLTDSQVAAISEDDRAIEEICSGYGIKAVTVSRIRARMPLFGAGDGGEGIAADAAIWRQRQKLARSSRQHRNADS